MTFEKLKLKPDKIKGEGEDTVGEFTLKGKVEDNIVNFKKEYEGKHKIYYRGIFDPQTGTINGHWRIEKDGGDLGEFKLTNEAH